MPHYLDAKGLSCPLPVLRAKKAIKSVPAGEVLVVEATDPGAPADFAAFCDAAGHQLVGCRAEAGVITLEIRRTG